MLSCPHFMIIVCSLILQYSVVCHSFVYLLRALVDRVDMIEALLSLSALADD